MSITGVLDDPTLVSGMNTCGRIESVIAKWSADFQDHSDLPLADTSSMIESSEEPSAEPLIERRSMWYLWDVAPR
jgi:hypothetical protein